MANYTGPNERNKVAVDHIYSYDRDEDEEPLLRLAAWVPLGPATL